MRRIASILLAVVFLATGSGAAEHAHRLQRHSASVAGASAAAPAGASVSQAADCDDHDAAGCPTCQSLHAPLSAAVPPPVLTWVGDAAGAVALAAPLLHARRVPLSIACRGPPASRS